MQLVHEIKHIIADQLSVPEHTLFHHTRFIDDLGADSLDTVELAATFETTFGVELSEDDVERTHTVGAAVRLIQQKRISSYEAMVNGR